MSAAEAARRALRPAALEMAAVLAAGMLVGLLGIGKPLGPFDEPIIYVGAERVLHGELPYRDFYALYPPAQFFAVAGVFTVFGVSVVAMRVYCVVVQSIFVLLLYLIARDLAGRTAAAAAAAAATLWLVSDGSYGYPVLPAMVLVLGAFVLLGGCVRHRDDPGRRSTPRLFAAGAMLSAAAFFRHDIAFYGLAAAVPFAWALTRDAPGARGGGRRIGPFLAGLVCVFVPVAAWLVASVPWDELVFELFTYPSTTYPAMRGLPYPPLFRMPADPWALMRPGPFADAVRMHFYAPMAFDAAALVLVAADVRRRGRAATVEPWNVVFISTALFSALLWRLASVRADGGHVMPLNLLSYPVAAALAVRAQRDGRTASRVAALAVTCTALLTLLMPMRKYRAPAVSRVAAAFAGATDGLERRSSNLEDDPHRLEVARYLRSVLPPGGRIFAGCGRHDRVFRNEPIFYVLVGGLPGSRYHELDPGVATLPDVQRRITADLTANGVGYLVLTTQYDDRNERNASSIPNGSTILDEYIRANYAVCFRSGPFLSVLRRTTPFAAGDGR